MSEISRLDTGETWRCAKVSEYVVPSVAEFIILEFVTMSWGMFDTQGGGGGQVGNVGKSLFTYYSCNQVR